MIRTIVSRRWAACLALMVMCIGVQRPVMAQGCGTWETTPGVAGVWGTDGRGRVSAVLPLPNGDLVVGGTFYVAGEERVANIAMFEASSGRWKGMGNPGLRNVTGVFRLPSGQLAAVGGASGLSTVAIALLDPVTLQWSTVPVPGSITSYNLNRATLLPGGELVFSGGFDELVGVPRSAGIVKYNFVTQTWSSLGEGLDDRVEARSTDLVLPLSDGRVLVAGKFSGAGGRPCVNVALYVPETQTWCELGTGFDDFVDAATELPNGDLLLAGALNTGGVVAHVSTLFRFRPSTGQWTEVPIAPATISELKTLSDGSVVVIGTFGPLPGTTGFNVCHYVPELNTFTSMGLGTTDPIDTAAVDASGSVIVGGEFTSISGVSGSNVLRFDPVGQSWHEIGSLKRDRVVKMRSLPGGDVLGIGGPSATLGIGPHGIARFSRSSGTWVPICSKADLSTQVWTRELIIRDADVLPNGDIVAVGTFTAIDGQAASSIARYDIRTGTWTQFGGSGFYRWPAETPADIESVNVLADGSVLISGWYNFHGETLEPASGYMRFNPRTGVWSQVPSNGVVSYLNCTARMSDGAIIFGGYAGLPDKYPRLVRYDPVTETISVITPPQSFGSIEDLVPLSGYRFAALANLVSNNVALMIYDVSTGKWDPYTTLSNEYGSADSCILLNDDAFLVSGRFTSYTTGSTSSLTLYRMSSKSWLPQSAAFPTNSKVEMLLAPDNSIFAYGEFGLVSNRTSSGVARFVNNDQRPIILSQPKSIRATFSTDAQVANFSVSAERPSGFQWRKNGIAISSTTNRSANTPNLSVTFSTRTGVLAPSTYDCVIQSPCGDVISDPATLVYCASDINGDGETDLADFLAFMDCFDRGAACADLNGHRTPDFFDFLAFFNAYDAGC